MPQISPMGRFAFVDFATPELQKLAVGLSERLLEGRKVLIKLGKSQIKLRPIQNRIIMPCAE